MTKKRGTFAVTSSYREEIYTYILVSLPPLFGEYEVT